MDKRKETQQLLPSEMHLLEVYFFITQGGGNVLCAGTQASLLGASDLPPVPPTSPYHSINFEKRHWQKDLQVLGSCVQPLSLGFENRETCFSFFSIPSPPESEIKNFFSFPYISGFTSEELSVSSVKWTRYPLVA